MSRDSGLRLFLLGAFRLERDGQAIHLATRKAEALLAYLVLLPEAHTREKLAALFWGEAPAARASGSLRTTLNTLRRALGDSAILGDRSTIQFNPQFPLGVDVRDLERTANEATPGLLERYQGDLLAEHYDDWIMPLRQHYRERRLAGLLQLTQAMRARSEYERAIEVAHRVLTEDSGNERAHQHLMFCYLATGDRDAALAQYDRCRINLRSEFEVDPLPETTALYQWIKQSPVPRLSTAASKTNLPIPLSRFIGRQRETAQLKQWLAAQAGAETPLRAERRLVTLTGSGGCGKTRLAIQVATDLIDVYEAGVWWCELAGLAEAALVPHAVAKALGVRPGPNRAVLEGLVEHLRSRHLLLVLDNCEHLIAACARLVDRLLGACPGLQILATSREALGLAGEVAWLVPSLSLPDPRPVSSVENVEQAESVLLFVERAAAVRPGFQLTIDNAPAVARVCLRLDGIPLAIELAAARVKVLSVDQIAARLDDRFGLLVTGSRTALPRHQTLRAALDWSYELLTGTEQRLLHRLAVFAGGFALEAAEAVAGFDDGASYGALDLLARLVNKSLVAVEPAEGEAARYRLLETICQYALARLAEAGEDRLVRERHLTYFTGLAEALDQKITGAEQAQALDQLEMEHDNLRAALDFAEAEPQQVEAGLALAGTLRRFWWARGHYAEGRERLERLLAKTNADARTLGRARALHGLGSLCHMQGDYATARRYLEASLAIYRELADDYGVAAVLNNLGVVAHEQGDNEQARVLVAESLELFRSVGDMTGLANALNNLGHIALEVGDLERARQYIEASVPVYQEAGNQQNLAYALYNLGDLARRQGEHASARAHHERALAIRRGVDDWPRVAWSLSALGEVVHEQGAEAAAQAALEESVQLFRQLGDHLGLATALCRFGRVRLRQEEITQAAGLFAEALRLFGKLGRQKEIAEALAGLGAAAAAEGQADRAARLLAAAQALLARLATRPALPDPFVYEQAVALAKAQMKPADFEAAWAAGQAMAGDKGAAAVAYALDGYG